jgi:hypothetical protein
MGRADDLGKLFGLTKDQVVEVERLAKSAAKIKCDGITKAKMGPGKLVSLGIPSIKELEDAIKKAKK